MSANINQTKGSNMWNFSTEKVLNTKLIKYVQEAYEAYENGQEYSKRVTSDACHYYSDVKLEVRDRKHFIVAYYTDMDTNKSKLIAWYCIEEQLIYTITDEYRTEKNDVKKLNNVRNGFLLGVKEITGANMYIYRVKLSHTNMAGDKTKTRLRFNVSFFDGKNLIKDMRSGHYLNYIEVWAKIGGGIRIEEHFDETLQDGIQLK